MSWKEALRAHIAEEQADHDTYLNLAEEAEQEHCFGAACILRDIAHEEGIHRKFLSEIVPADMVDGEKILRI